MEVDWLVVEVENSRVRVEASDCVVVSTEGNLLPVAAAESDVVTETVAVCTGAKGG